MKTAVVKRVLKIPMEAYARGTIAQGLVQGMTSGVSFIQLVLFSLGA